MVASDDNHFMTSESLTDAITGLRRHYTDSVLSIWRNRGFDPNACLPYETVRADSVPAPQRFRAMACARQLYIFSELGDQEHADRLFSSLIRYFRDTRHGGFFYSVSPSGEPLETEKDLYTHAFVIFACAAYLQRFRVATALSVLSETTEVVTSLFPRNPTHGGLMQAVANADFSLLRADVRQNPLMHLTEACLLAREVTGDTVYETLLDTILSGIRAHFVDAESACIMELPADAPENWIEPGHQFEWLFFSEQSNYPGFEHTGLRASLRRAFAFASLHGVDPATGGVAATMDRRGRVVDDTQRIWAQTEYLRALASHPDANVRATLAAQIVRFRSRFLRQDGWNECLSPDGLVTRADMPSTTPYHLASAYAALSTAP